MSATSTIPCILCQAEGVPKQVLLSNLSTDPKKLIHFEGKCRRCGWLVIISWVPGVAH